jgi:hypothetical protein
MPLYFLLLDAADFERRVRPALAASWLGRSFEPCRPLCEGLTPAALAFRDRYHTGPDEPLICQVARGLSFDRDRWRLLVGEVLFTCAAEIPEFQTAPETLACLVGVNGPGEGPVPREMSPPIWQAHHGSHDLVLGRFYRPEHAGFNNAEDVRRLAGYLAGIDPDRWRADDLRALPEMDEEEDRQDELAFARQCLVALREMYDPAARRGQVIVCEVI